MRYSTAGRSPHSSSAHGAGVQIVHCVDAETFRRLGELQGWCCQACNAPLELGSEELAFFGDEASGFEPIAVLVHGECRAGVRLRIDVAGVWKGLEDSDAKAAAARYETMRASMAGMAARTAAALAPPEVDGDREESPATKIPELD